AVGNAGNPDAAVVAGNIFEQPLDRIVRVRALVNGLGVSAVPGRPQHHKFAAGIEASANVLNHENVAAGQHFGIGGEVPGVAGGVAGGAVGRAHEEEGQGFGGLPRRVNFRVQAHTIAHGNHQ